GPGHRLYLEPVKPAQHLCPHLRLDRFWLDTGLSSPPLDLNPEMLLALHQPILGSAAWPARLVFERVLHRVLGSALLLRIDAFAGLEASLRRLEPAPHLFDGSVDARLLEDVPHAL